MQSRPNKQSILTASLALVIIAASGIAGAAPEKKQKRDKDVLRGPDVTTTDRPAKHRDKMDTMDNADPMTDRIDKSDKQARLPIIYRDYLLALRQMKNSNALELTQSQQEQVKNIATDHRQAMKDFQEQHRDKIKAMREEMRAARDAQRDARPDQSAIEPADRKPQASDRGMQAREKLRSFIDNAPANRDALSKLKQVLSAEQQTMLKAKVIEARAKKAANAGQSGQRQDRARRERGDDSEKTSPSGKRTTRQSIDPDKVERSGNKNAKRSKREKPTPQDD